MIHAIANILGLSDLQVEFLIVQNIGFIGCLICGVLSNHSKRSQTLRE